MKYRKDEGNLLDDPTGYRKLVGGLIYLTITRPDIPDAVNLMSQFMIQPTQLHMLAANQIICYLHGTQERDIFFQLIPICALLPTMLWIGLDADPRRSTTGWCVYLGDALIS